MNGRVSAEPFRCGSVGVIGRPNVGKSTLVNALVGAKISITSRKPQTTRHRIRGILSTDEAQTIFVDTPGFQTEHGSALNRIMNRGIGQAIGEVDCVLMLVEAARFGAADERLLKMVPAGVPLIVAVNKIDRVSREVLIPFLQKLAESARISEIVPVSAARRKGLEELMATIRKYLPPRDAMFAADEMTDRSESFLASEMIREKLFRLLGDELPYGSGVVIDKFEEKRGMRRIFASIVVDKDNHKAMIIGSGGAKLKRIASEARLDMEMLFGSRVYLEVWVKVRSGWTDDDRALKHMGYE